MRVKRLLATLTTIFLVFQLFVPFLLPVTFASGNGYASNDLEMVVTGANKVVLGMDTNIRIQMKNKGNSMAYNVGIEVALPDGMELSGGLSPTLREYDSSSGKNIYFWQDLKNIATTETFAFDFTVKVKDEYIDGSDIQFGDTLALDVRAYASDDPRQLYRDRNNPTKEESILTEVVPFLLKLESSNKNVKGAGDSSFDTNATEWGELPYSISIVNNMKYPTTFEHLTNEVDGAVQLYNFKNGTENVSSNVSVQNNKRTATLNNLTWGIGEKRSVTFNAAHMNQEMLENEDNDPNAAVIQHGARKDIVLTYTATVNGVTYSGTEAHQVVAHDIVIYKSVDKSTTGYNDTLTYTLTVKTNEYYDVNNVVVTDTLGDGQTFQSHIGSLSDGQTRTEPIVKNSDGTSTIKWDLGTLGAKTTTILQYTVTVDDKWVQSDKPIYAGDVLSNHVLVTGNTDPSGAVQDTDSTAVSISTPTISEKITEVNNKAVGDGAKQAVTVGDTVTFEVAYDAVNLPVKQHDVVIYDYLPLGTILLDNDGNKVTNSLGADNNVLTAYNINNVTPEYDKNLHALIWTLEDLPENQNSVLDTSIKVLIADDKTHVLADKGAKNIVILTYSNTAGIQESKRAEVELEYVEPKITMTRTVSETKDLQGGQTITVTITIKNEGDSPAYHINYNEKLADGLVDPISDGGDFPFTFDADKKIIVFNEIPKLDPNQTKQLKYKVKIINPIGAGRDIVINDAEWDYVGQDTPISNNEQREYEDNETGQTVITAKKPTIKKEVIDTSYAGDVSNARPGDWIIYEIQVTVPQNTVTYEPKITNKLHTSESYEAVFSDYITIGSGSGTTPTAPIAVTSSGSNIEISGLPEDQGSTYTYYVKTKVKDLAKGSDATIQQDAVFTWKDRTGSTPTIKTVTSSKTTVSIKTPNLTGKISLEVDQPTSPIQKGNQRTLIFEIENNGGNPAYNFVPSITIPQGFKFISVVDPKNGSAFPPADQTMTFNNVTRLDPGAANKLKYEFTIELEQVKGAGSIQTISGTTGNYYSTDGMDPQEYDASTVTHPLNITAVTLEYTVKNKTTGDVGTPAPLIWPNVRPGDTVEYTATVTVPAGTTAYDLKLKDSFDLNSFELVSINKQEDSSFVTPLPNASPFLITIGDVTEQVSNQVFTYIFNLQAKTNQFNEIDQVFNSHATAKWYTDVEKTDSKQTSPIDAKILVVQPKLEISKSALANSQFSASNEEIELKFHVANSGASDAYNTNVTATLPAGLEIVDDTITNGGVKSGSVESGYIVTWSNLDPIKPDEKIDLSFIVKTNPAIISPATNGLDVIAVLNSYTSKVESPNKSYNPNTSVKQALTVAPVALTLTKESTTNGLTDLVRMGDEITYSLQVTVPSNTTAFQSVLSKDAILNEQEIVAVYRADGITEIHPSGSFYELGDLTSGENTFVVKTAIKTDGAYNPDPIQGNNPYKSSYEAKITYQSQNVGGTAVTVTSNRENIDVGQPHLQILLSSDKTEFTNPDDEITFTMDVTNDGPVPAYNAQIQLQLPDGIHLTAVNSTPHSGTSYDWNLEPLLSNGTQQLKFKVTADVSTVVESVYAIDYTLIEYFSLPNRLGKTYDPTSSNLINVTVRGEHAWDSTKDVIVRAGQTATVVHTLTNNGAGHDTFDISVESPYNADLYVDNQLVSMDRQISNHTVSLDAGESVTVVVDVHVPENTPDDSNAKPIKLSAVGVHSGKTYDVQDSLYVDGIPLDGWVGSSLRAIWTEAVLAPKDPLKFSAISSNHISAVKAYYSYSASGTPKHVEVELTLVNPASYISDGEKRWENVTTFLPDDIGSGQYGVTFRAYNENGIEIQIDEPTGAYGANNPFTVKAALTIHGQVTDAANHSPIAAATVKLFDGNGKYDAAGQENTPIAIVNTDSNGNYTFGEHSAGLYHIVVAHEDYPEAEKNVFALPNDTISNEIVVNFALTTYKITLSANPTTIVGDGKSQTILTAIVTDHDGNPVQGVTVSFDAKGKGTFPSGTTATTDEFGKAFVPYTSHEIVGFLSERFPVTASATLKGQVVHAEVYVIFEPGAISGVVTAATEGGSTTPVAGANIEIRSKSSGELIGSAITGADGKYSIAIPRGGVEYVIEITKPVNVGGTTQWLTYSQEISTGFFDAVDKDKNINHPERGAIGYIVIKQPDQSYKPIVNDPAAVPGKPQLWDSTKVKFTGAGFDQEATFNPDGTFSIPNLPAGNYDMAVVFELEPGKTINLSHQKITVSDVGEVTIIEELIDPYGTITDATTGNVIEGAHVELYYADTDRNKKSRPGDIGKLVVLPILPGFEPNDNANPQDSDQAGFYAYMVYGFTDYVLKVTKPGYQTYTSPIISVEEDIVKHDLQMFPIVYSGSGSLVSNQADLSISISTDRARYQEGSEITYTIHYRNNSTGRASNVSIAMNLSEYTTVLDGAAGSIESNRITWSIGELKGGDTGSIVLTAKVMERSLSKSEVEIQNKVEISSNTPLINTKDDISTIQLLLFTNRYTAGMHKRYIKGFPDGEFKPNKEITRAEIAAIFARIMDLEGTVTGTSFYPDVKREYWASEYIEAVTKAGLFKGFEDGEFKPNQAITRAELATVIARYLRVTDQAIDELHFTDIENNWAKREIEQVYRFHIIKGYEDGTFRPANKLIRVEAVTMINRLLQRGPLHGSKQTFPDVGPSYWGFGEVEESANTHEYIRNSDGSETLTKLIPEPLW